MCYLDEYVAHARWPFGMEHICKMIVQSALGRCEEVYVKHAYPHHERQAASDPPAGDVV